jgi:Fe-Mn family superoxide dismutase
MNRRQMLIATGAGAAALLLPKLALAEDKPAGFTLPKLPYDYDALEPIIDKMTMTIHHDKHHQAYVDNLNKAVAGADWAGMSIDELVKKVKDVPEAKRAAVINNGGGHWNHSFFWTIMAAKGQGGEASGDLAKSIESFGGMAKLKEEVQTKGLGRFGSGWVWVVAAKSGKLDVVNTANQDNPLMAGRTPILGIDVWEHAYYLKYQNRRADYLKAWWDVANWKAISENFLIAKVA